MSSIFRTIAAYNTNPDDQRNADIACNGSNDSSIVQSVINDVKFSKSKSGKIQLLEGNFDLSNIMLAPNIEFEGIGMGWIDWQSNIGTMLRVPSGKVMFHGAGETARNLSFEKICFSGNGIIYVLDNPRDAYWEDCLFYMCGQAIKAARPWDLTIENTIFNRCGNGAPIVEFLRVDGDNGNLVIFDKARFEVVGGDCIFGDVAFMKILNSKFETRGVDDKKHGYSAIKGKLWNMTLANSHFLGGENGGDAVHLEKGTSSCFIHHNYIERYKGYGLYCDGEYNQIDHMIIHYTGKPSLYFGKDTYENTYNHIKGWSNASGWKLIDDRGRNNLK